MAGMADQGAPGLADMDPLVRELEAFLGQPAASPHTLNSVLQGAQKLASMWRRIQDARLSNRDRLAAFRLASTALGVLGRINHPSVFVPLLEALERFNAPLPADLSPWFEAVLHCLVSATGVIQSSVFSTSAEDCDWCLGLVDQLWILLHGLDALLEVLAERAQNQAAARSLDCSSCVHNTLELQRRTMVAAQDLAAWARQQLMPAAADRRDAAVALKQLLGGLFSLVGFKVLQPSRVRFELETRVRGDLFSFSSSSSSSSSSSLAVSSSSSSLSSSSSSSTTHHETTSHRGEPRIMMVCRWASQTSPNDPLKEVKQEIGQLLVPGYRQVRLAAQEALKALLEVLSAAEPSSGNGASGGLPVDEDVALEFAWGLFDLCRGATFTNEFTLMSLLWSRLGKECARFRSALGQAHVAAVEARNEDGSVVGSCSAWLRRLLGEALDGDRAAPLVTRVLRFAAAESVHTARECHISAPDLVELTKTVKILRFLLSLVDKFLVPLVQGSALEAMIPIADAPAVPARELCQAAIACLGLADLEWPGNPGNLALLRQKVQALLWPMAAQIVQRTVPVLIPRSGEHLEQANEGQPHTVGQLQQAFVEQPEYHCRELVRACFGVEHLERPVGSSGNCLVSAEAAKTAAAPLGVLLALLAVLETPFAYRRHLSSVLARHALGAAVHLLQLSPYPALLEHWSTSPPEPSTASAAASSTTGAASASASSSTPASTVNPAEASPNARIPLYAQLVAALAHCWCEPMQRTAVTAVVSAEAARFPPLAEMLRLLWTNLVLRHPSPQTSQHAVLALLEALIAQTCTPGSPQRARRLLLPRNPLVESLCSSLLTVRASLPHSSGSGGGSSGGTPLGGSGGGSSSSSSSSSEGCSCGRLGIPLFQPALFPTVLGLCSGTSVTTGVSSAHASGHAGEARQLPLIPLAAFAGPLVRRMSCACFAGDSDGVGNEDPQLARLSYRPGSGSGSGSGSSSSAGSGVSGATGAAALGLRSCGVFIQRTGAALLDSCLPLVEKLAVYLSPNDNNSSSNSIMNSTSDPNNTTTIPPLVPGDLLKAEAALHGLDALLRAPLASFRLAAQEFLQTRRSGSHSSLALLVSPTDLGQRNLAHIAPEMAAADARLAEVVVKRRCVLAVTLLLRAMCARLQGLRQNQPQPNGSSSSRSSSPASASSSSPTSSSPRNDEHGIRITAWHPVLMGLLRVIGNPQLMQRSTGAAGSCWADIELAEQLALTGVLADVQALTQDYETRLRDAVDLRVELWGVLASLLGSLGELGKPSDGGSTPAGVADDPGLGRHLPAVAQVLLGLVRGLLTSVLAADALHMDGVAGDVNNSASSVNGGHIGGHMSENGTSQDPSHLHPSSRQTLLAAVYLLRQTHRFATTTTLFTHDLARCLPQDPRLHARFVEFVQDRMQLEARRKQAGSQQQAVVAASSALGDPLEQEALEEDARALDEMLPARLATSLQIRSPRSPTGMQDDDGDDDAVVSGRQSPTGGGREETSMIVSGGRQKMQLEDDQEHQSPSSSSSPSSPHSLSSPANADGPLELQACVDAVLVSLNRLMEAVSQRLAASESNENHSNIHTASSPTTSGTTGQVTIGNNRPRTQPDFDFRLALDLRLEPTRSPSAAAVSLPEPPAWWNRVWEARNNAQGNDDNSTTSPGSGVNQGDQAQSPRHPLLQRFEDAPAEAQGGDRKVLRLTTGAASGQPP